jgi:hypothetical protein
VRDDGERFRCRHADGLVAAVIATGPARHGARRRFRQQPVGKTRGRRHHAPRERDGAKDGRSAGEPFVRRIGGGRGDLVLPRLLEQRVRQRRNLAPARRVTVECEVDSTVTVGSHTCTLFRALRAPRFLSELAFHRATRGLFHEPEGNARAGRQPH